MPTQNKVQVTLTLAFADPITEDDLEEIEGNVLAALTAHAMDMQLAPEYTENYTVGIQVEGHLA